MIRQTKLATQAQTVAETIGNLRDELERLVVNASTTACLSTKVTAQSPRPRPRGHRSAVCAGPAELGSVGPDAVHDDGKLASNCHHGPPHPPALGNSHAPRLEATTSV